jgi:phosphopantetheinyl transferase
MTLWIVSIKDPYLLLNYELILEKLNDSEKAAVKRFVFPEDRYRALLSILLQHALIIETFGFIRNEEYSILRTSEVGTLFQRNY